MDSLLQLAFDNLSSYDGHQIKKGLKQVEGLLAQLCVAPDGSKVKKPPASDQLQGGKKRNGPATRPTAELIADPAFREFFRLQEGFEYNITQRLLNTLDRLVARGGDGQNDLLILSALDLTQGVLLLHPPSKSLFSEEKSMNILLDLMEPINCPIIQCSTLLLLVVALIDCPRNTRTFEKLDGLLTVTTLFRNPDTSRDVKLKLVEFVYFYLMPETPSLPCAEARVHSAAPALLQRSPSKLAKAFKRGAGDAKSDAGPLEGTTTAAEPGPAKLLRLKRANSEEWTLSIEEKMRRLDDHLPNVDDLVRDLRVRNDTLFNGVVS